LKFEITNKENATCSGAMGNITVQAISGTLPYTYTLANQTKIDEQGGGATFDIPAGNYTIFVRTADGCTKSLLFSISEPSALALTLDNTSQSCSNAPTGAIASNLQGGTPPYTYTWSNGANTQNITDIAAGNYALTVHDGNGCITSESVLVTSYADFDVDAGIDVTITAGQTTELSGTTTAIPPYTVLWTPSTGLSDASIVNPVVSATETTTYTLQITSADGCANTDAVVITVVPFVKDAFAIPSAFTPNGDNRNDIFRPIATGTVQVNRFLVLNKWGEKIHEGLEGWDGTYKNAPQPVGSYTYLVEYKDVDGQQKSKAGQVMLIR
jgi:gliding motility-associated-like protein